MDLLVLCSIAIDADGSLYITPPFLRAAPGSMITYFFGGGEDSRAGGEAIGDRSQISFHS